MSDIPTAVLIRAARALRTDAERFRVWADESSDQGAAILRRDAERADQDAQTIERAARGVLLPTFRAARAAVDDRCNNGLCEKPRGHAGYCGAREAIDHA